MDRTKLLVTASTFPRWKDDTEPRFILDVCKELNKYFDVTVLVPASPGAKDNEILEGINVIRYHYFPVHSWETLCYPGAIVPRIKEKKVRGLLVPFLFLGMRRNLKKLLPLFDLVHSNWIIPQGIIQCGFDKPYVVTGLGGDVSSLNKGWVLKRKKKCLVEAKAITAVSKSLRNQMLHICPDVKVDVIPMGCEIEQYGKQNRIINYFGDTKRKVLLFVGRLAEKKGCEYLIRAMDKVEADLIIVGDGPLKRDLEALAKTVHADIRFLGAKTKEELRTIYASSDIFVVPSVTAKDGDKEGVPTAIIEAMASELPVIASDSGGISDIVKDGFNGYLVSEKNVLELSEKINELILDEKKRIIYAANARLTAEKYDYVEIGKKYRNVFMNIIDR